MQVMTVILKSIVGLMALLCAICCSSVGNMTGLVASILPIGLIIPKSAVRHFGRVAGIPFVVLMWRILHTYFTTHLDRVSWGDIACVIVLSECMILSHYQSRKIRAVLWVGACLVMLYLSCQAYVRESASRESKTAFLERGQWGISHTNEFAYNVNSQYSYTLIKKMLSAEVVSSLERIRDYDSLWIITPTKPFRDDEIEALEQWVHGGGHLNIVSDHTDLFGHASVLNKLLQPYDIEIGRDCVIGEHPDDSPYWSVVGWFYGMTANSIKGDCWPFLLQFGFKERTDYNGRSFFSDGAVTDEDQWGVYCVGARKSYGQGSIIVFADSTMFADFALSRPSSQLVLRMIRDNLYAVNFPILLLLLSLLMLILESSAVQKRQWLMWLLVALVLVSIIMYITYFGYSAKVALGKPLEKGKRGLPTCGNWDLVDVTGRGYDVLFAANFASQIPMPEWRMIPKHSGNIRCNGGSLPRLETTSLLSNEKDLESILSTPPSISISQYLDSLKTGSTRDGFWFEAGIGLCKEHAYKNFWRSLVSLDVNTLRLGDPRRIRACYVLNGKKSPVREIFLSEFVDVNDWLIVGDWLLGKKIENAILLRNRWQEGSRHYGDIIIYPEGNDAQERNQ